jgi:uncharacterized Zn-binding protein involved in type VI secretion
MADVPNAARIEDPIFHTNALLGALTGLAIGLVVGVVAAALVIGTIVTGGALLVAVLTVCTAVSLCCTAVSLGFGIGGFIGEHAGGTVTGLIEHGSVDTFIGGEELQAARVEAEVKCSWHAEEPKVAAGSKTVFINSKNASRVEDKITCGAAIKAGCPTVGIGGESINVLKVEPEIPEWLEHTIEIVDIAGVVLGFIGSFGAKEALKEVTLGAIDLALMGTEFVLKHELGADSRWYQGVVWTRRGYEAVLLGRGLREGFHARAERAEIRAGDAPSHVLGPNGERINMRGEPVPGPGPRPEILGADGRPINAPPEPRPGIIDPSAPTPQPNAHIIDPSAPTPQPNAHIIDPSAPTPQPNAHIIDPSAPTPGKPGGLLGADGRPLGGG